MADVTSRPQQLTRDSCDERYVYKLSAMSKLTKAQRRDIQDLQRAVKTLGRMTPRATELILCRHGETDWNLEHRLQGQSAADPPLNARGFEQAEMLAQRLKTERIDAIYSSDLRRTMQTAECIAALRNQEVIPTPGLRERGLGVLEGLQHAEAKAMQPDAWAALYSEGTAMRIPGGGESLDDLMERTVAVCERIAANHPGQRVLVITHGGMLQAAYWSAVGHDYPGKMVNCAINTIRVEGSSWAVTQWGDTQHLDKVGFQKSAFGGDKSGA